MKKLTSLKFVSFLSIALLLTSCWTTREISIVHKPVTYIGNSYDIYKGKNKNQILQGMAVAPDRTMSDGATGEILIYEDTKIVTNSLASSSFASSSASAAVGGYTRYGNPAVVGGSATVSGSDYYSNTTTSRDKKFVNFFINKEGICYNVRTNVGDMYSPEDKEIIRYKKPWHAGWWCVYPVWGWSCIPNEIYYATKKKYVKYNGKMMLKSKFLQIVEEKRRRK